MISALMAGGTAIAQPPPHPAPASDVNTDGNTDNADLAEFVNAWNAAVAAGPQQPTGACCVGTACYRTTQARCTQLGGTWEANVSCTTGPNPCAAPTPTGACCTGTACTVTTQAACAGTYKGDGTSCTPNPCQPPPPSTGWTDLTPPAGATVYYVAANGNDSANGTSTATPFRTVARGLSAVRDGSADQVLLRKGDTFAGPITLTKTGQSATARIVIGAYGTGPRPVITIANGQNGFDRGCGQSNGNLIIANLEVRAASGSEYVGGPGSGCGISWFCGPAFSGKNILIEGCKFTRLFRGMELQDCESLVVRRSVFEDICSRTGAGYSPQAIYVGLTRNVTIDENIIVTKAFTSVRAPYQQDTMVYLQDECEGTVLIRRNLITSKGGQGPQGLSARSHATLSDNFMDGCHTGIHVGGQDTPPSGKYPNGTHYNVTGNVITRLVNMTNQAGGERGIGIQYAYFDTVGTLIADNIISNKTVTTDGTGLNSDPAHYGPTRKATIRGNILYNANGIQFQGSGSTGNTITGNFVINPGSASAENALVNPFATSVGTWSGNTYWSSRADGTWFQVNYANRSFAQWQSVEPTAIRQQVAYPDPSRGLTTYAASLGLAATWDAAAGALLGQSRDSWDTRWTADALVGYVRGGFAASPR